MKRKAGIAGGLCLILTGIAACMEKNTETGILALQEEPQESMELELFFSGENTVWIRALEELCDNFTEKYPKIHLKMEYSSSQNYAQELKAKEAAGEFPDVFELEDPYTLAEAGKLGVMDQEIGDLVKEPIVIQDKIYALPFYSTSYGIVYNQVLFKRLGLSLPKNYGEFTALCETIRKQGIAPLAGGGSEDSSLFGWLNYFFLTEIQKGEDSWIEKKQGGKAAFRDENMVEVLSDFQELMTGENMLKDSADMGDNQIISHMIDQEAAMYYGTPSMLAKIWEACPEAVDSGKTPMGEDIEDDQAQIRLGWFYLPDASGESVVIDKTGSVLGISEECAGDPKKKEAANTFLKFCYERENYRKILQAMNGIPVTKDAVLYAAPAVQQEVLKDYRYAKRSGEFLGNTQTPEAFQVQMKEILELLAEGKTTPGNAAGLLDQAWDGTGEEQGE